VLILLLKLMGFEWDNKMLVSSANIIGTDISLTNLGRSVIEMRKSKGCNFIIFIIQQCSLISTGQIRFVKFI